MPGSLLSPIWWGLKLLMAVLLLRATQQSESGPHLWGSCCLWLSTVAVQALLDSDPKLTQYEDHFQYRYSVYQKWKKEIEAECGTLADFAKVSWHRPPSSRVIPSSCCCCINIMALYTSAACIGNTDMPVISYGARMCN